jgi:hypothetical protein
MFEDAQIANRKYHLVTDIQGHHLVSKEMWKLLYLLVAQFPF